MDKDKVKNWLDEMSNYDINHIISFIRGIYNEKCDIEEELNKYKIVLDKIKEISNQVKEEALEVENGWTYQVMKEIDYVLEEIE